MDLLDRGLLDLIQRRVPLVREPYAQLAGELGCAEAEVLDRLSALRGPGRVVREISGVFDAAAVGYEQALVAMPLPPERLDAAGAIVADHPGVSHCYARTGRLNLWFTLACSPASALGLDRTAVALARLARATSHLVLPTLRRYKLDVRFGADAAEGEEPPPPSSPAPETPKPRCTPSAEQVLAIRALQDDLPNHADPFAPLAERAETSADVLLVHAADFLSAGWMRRYAAVLRHRLAGAEANLLVAWCVEDSAADAAGTKCARSPAVSHCYLRPAGPDWPYNLYTMIHGRTEQDCRMAVEELAATTGLSRRAELWTTKEYKKQRVRLFGEEEAAWEERRA